METGGFFGENADLLRTYAAHVAILALKMAAIVVMTIRARLKYKAFHSEEDAAYSKGPVKQDPRVERIRKCHLNDMETNYLFMGVSLLYLTTNPCPTLATWLFRLFTASRLAHTYVYVIKVTRQPARAYSWLLGFAVIIYMASATLYHHALYV